MKKAKQIIVLLICMTIALTLLSVQSAFAAESSGTCGDNLTWVFDSDTGTLTISGEGDMNDYSAYFTKVPWRDYLDHITSVTISNGVSSIGNYSFCECSKLTSIVIPDGITSIGNYAFSECSKLRSVAIPDSVTAVGSCAFSECSALSSITLPDNMTSIGSCAFSSSGYYNDDNNWSDGLLYIGPYLVSTRSSEIGDAVSLKDTTTIIADEAFKNCKTLESITIPDSVTVIGSCAFEYCSSLTSAVIGSGVTSFAEDAFLTGGASSALLTDLVIHSNCGKAFKSMYTLERVTFGEGVTEIAEKSFSNCMNLSSVTLSDGITSIGGNAFYSCSNLQYINFPNSITSIGDYAFCDCSSLTEIVLPESLTSINDGIFCQCDNLVSVTFPKNVTSIGTKAFFNCYELASPAIPESVTLIKESAFYSCHNLTDIHIPASVTSIGSSAFFDCIALENVYCDSLESWCGISFADFKANPLYYADNFYVNGELVKNLVIPGTVSTVNSYAFYGFSAPISVTILSGVESIGSYAFYKLSALTEIFIPESLTSIGNYAFYGCSALTEVYYEGTEDDWANIAIGYYNDPLTSSAIHYSYVAPIDNIFYGIGAYEGVIEADVTVSESGTVNIIMTRKSGTTSLKTADIKAYVAVYSGGAVTSVTPLSKSAAPSRAVFSGTASGNYKIFLWDENMQPMTETIE